MSSSATLSSFSKNIAYGDTSSSSNPRLRHFDWARNVEGITVANPKTESLDLVTGGVSTVFDCSRSTSIDGTTAFDITLNSTNSSTYRFTRSAGTLPAFRVDRGLSLSGIAITVSALVNGTATFTLPVGPSSWGTAIAGDTLFVPGTATGDSASPFNALNVGWWLIMSVGSKTITATRLPGATFEAYSEVVTLTSASQVQAFSSAGVQIGDSMDLLAGFAVGSRKSYTVTAVTPTWVEVTSTSAIALETGIIPGTSGIAFYDGAKRFIRIEADQECVVKFNGESSSTVRISPVTASDSTQIGWLEKFGLTWKLQIVNLSASTLNVLVLSAE